LRQRVSEISYESTTQLSQMLASINIKLKTLHVDRKNEVTKRNSSKIRQKFVVKNKTTEDVNHICVQ